MTPPNVVRLYCNQLRAAALGCYATPVPDGGVRPHTPVTTQAVVSTEEQLS